MSAPSLDRLGQALADRYTLIREIGQGGMATVYLAEDLRLHRQVALKVLRPEISRSLGPERFLHEIDVAARLQHPHILSLLDAGQVDVDAGAPDLYYTMPFVAGESLRNRLDRETYLGLDEALRIAREVGDALSHAHSRGIVHRDIKPENILLSEGHAVVADFGIAKAVTSTGQRFTQTEVTLGTPHYMSPEQADSSRPVDGRSDLYSLACVLYEMLAGQPPFTAPTAQAVLARHALDPVPSLCTLRETVPASVEVAITRALAKVPADRFASVGEFVAALTAAHATGGRPPARLRRLAATAIAGVIVGVAAWVGRGLIRKSGVDADLPGPRPYTVVAAVDGTAGEDVRTTAQHLLITALDESGVISALPEEQVRQGLRLAGKPDTARLDLALAHDLAVRGSIRTVVAARADRVGATYHLVVRVLDADTRSVIAARSAVALGDDEVIPTLDRLMRAIRETLGERRSLIAANRPLIDVMTPSLAAYRKYRRAVELHYAGDLSGSIALLREALALDSQFASAWLQLGSSLYNQRRLDSAAKAFETAARFPERLTDRERYHLEFFTGSEGQGVGVYDRLLQQYPNDMVAHHRRAAVLAASGQWEEAFEAWRVAERASPFGLSVLSRWGQFEVLVATGRMAEARTLIATLPDDAAWAANLVFLEASGAWAQVENTAARVGGPDASAPIVLTGRASAMAARGAVTAAERILREGILARVGSGYDNVVFDHWQERARLLLAIASGRRFAGLLEPLASDSTLSGLMTRAMWAGMLGDTVETSRLVAKFAASVPTATRNTRANRVTGDFMRGWDAFAAHKWHDLIRHLAPVAVLGVAGGNENLPGSLELRWLVAEAYERLAMPDSAAAVFESIVSPRGLPEQQLQIRGIPYSFAHQRLVVLYARLGRLDDARRHWKIFSETFTTPDPELRHLVDEAREALLAAERRAG